MPELRARERRTTRASAVRAGRRSPSAEPSREQRKVVTVLFCDLVGSTALGESTDPEALRARMRRYFEDLRAILERHGGTVEKFVGDAVMAVFGIPVSHEDDALRAVRAAAEMRAAIAEHGLEARIGVNTGEVVVGGEGETLVTGDAVNVAARLEQAAATGEIAHRRRDAAARPRRRSRRARRAARAQGEVRAGRGVPPRSRCIGDAAPLARHLETPLVGRERERQRLWRDYEDAVADRTCRLFTLLGPAGIGKSRLVADFLERVGDSADVLRGRCLSYGEGITYWPLVEILIAIGVEPDSVIGTSPPETQLAFRRLLEARAAERPQVVVIDDLQWAEPVFVDLVEHVADLSRDAPIFLLCVARTELLDVRPGWGGGKLNATSLLLEPLGADECARAHGSTRHRRSARRRAARAHHGRVRREPALRRGDARDGARARRTARSSCRRRSTRSCRRASTRSTATSASSWSEAPSRARCSIAAPSPSCRPDPVRPAVDVAPRDARAQGADPLDLADVSRGRGLPLPPPPHPRRRVRVAAEGDAGGAARALRRLAREHDLVEGDEIVGYHLEQAHRYRSELDPADPALPRLAARVSDHLAAAGRGAMDRGDFNAGRSLFRRATAILPDDDPKRLALAPDLSLALLESEDLDGALTALAQARNASDPVTAAIATIVENSIDFMGGGSIPLAERLARLEDAHGLLTAPTTTKGSGTTAGAWQARSG